MNNDEAKFILNARRPHRADDKTPTMREALAQAARDPALGEWLTAQTEFDAKVTDALREVKPPAHLRDLILAGAAVQPTVRPWWTRQAPWLAMAASIAISGAVVVLGPAGFARKETAPSLAMSDDLAGLRDLALRESRGMHDHAVHADKLGAFGQWLENPVQRLTIGLPVDFAALQALGCRTLTVGGRDVLEVCFKRDQVYHLYVARRSDFPEVGAGSRPQFTTRENVSTALWADDKMVYVLATNGTERDFAVVL
jgi:hypothetical protein